MARIRFVLALTILALPLLLCGCGPTRLHILIPDFNAKGVDGLRIYRVGSGGALADAGYIAFGGIILTADGLQMQYMQYAPDKTTWGPLMVPVQLPGRGQVALEMAFLNRGTPGYFRFASYNEHGTSRPTVGQLFAGG
jgi:hypothetical protein